MAELRGALAPPEIKAEWERAYELYRRAPGVPHDKKLDRTERQEPATGTEDFDA